LNPQAGKLALDLADVALPLVESLALSLRESLLRLGCGDGTREVALGRLEHRGTPCPPGFPRTFLDLAHEPLLELGHVTRALGERPLHLGDLGESVLVTRAQVR
jgi:hypothetical protein